MTDEQYPLPEGARKAIESRKQQNRASRQGLTGKVKHRQCGATLSTAQAAGGFTSERAPWAHRWKPKGVQFDPPSQVLRLSGVPELEAWWCPQCGRPVQVDRDVTAELIRGWREQQEQHTGRRGPVSVYLTG